MLNQAVPSNHVTRPRKTRETYFAYGSNLQASVMRNRCPSASAVCSARLTGYEFVIAGFGAATIRRRAGSTVYGRLWTINHNDIHGLDQFEGVGLGVYSRRLVRVVAEDGQTIHAHVYIACPTETGFAHTEYLGGVIAAGADCGFPTSYLIELGRWAA